MKTKTGEQVPVKYQANGKPVMVPRLIYAEPELWDLMERKGAAAGVTRSTYCRKSLKMAHKKCSKIDGIDWSE
jgi:hypothetical protein